MAMTICIAEDNPDLQMILMTVFQVEECDVHLATDGEEAIACVEQHHPDLIVLDVNMPKLSGFDVLRHIRQTPDLQAMKVVIITGNMQAVNAPEADLADLVLTKPVDVFELKTFVKRLMSASV